MASRLFQRFYLFATSGGAPEGRRGGSNFLVRFGFCTFLIKNQGCFFDALSSKKKHHAAIISYIYICLDVTPYPFWLKPFLLSLFDWVLPVRSHEAQHLPWPWWSFFCFGPAAPRIWWLTSCSCPWQWKTFSPTPLIQVLILVVLHLICLALFCWSGFRCGIYARGSLYASKWVLGILATRPISLLMTMLAPQTVRSCSSFTCVNHRGSGRTVTSSRPLTHGAAGCCWTWWIRTYPPLSSILWTRGFSTIPARSIRLRSSHQ